jgi:hypothetical protein
MVSNHFLLKIYIVNRVLCLIFVYSLIGIIPR